MARPKKQITITEEEKEQKGDSVPFNRFFAKVFEEVDPVIQLYRVKQVGRKYKKTYLKTFYEVPDNFMDTIGNEFGGGSFWCVGDDGTEEMKSRYIDLDELWTRKLEERKLIKEQIALPAMAGAAVDPFAGIERLITVVTPMIELYSKVKTPAASSSLLDKQLQPLLNTFMATMSTGLRQMGKAAVENQQEYLKQPPEVAEGGGELSGMGKEIVGIAKDLIGKWGDKFLAAKGTREEIYKEEIQNSAEFKNLSSQDLADVFDECSADPKIGKEKISAIYAKLKFKVNQEEETAA